MGLDVSHDCWHGAYSAFMRWREEIAKTAGLPPIHLMEGFYKPGNLRWLDNKASFVVESAEKSLPISWDCLKPSPLHELLYHSDCEGEIAWVSCATIADALEALIPLLPTGDGGGHIGNWKDKTTAFIDGLRLAATKKETVKFR